MFYQSRKKDQFFDQIFPKKEQADFRVAQSTFPDFSTSLFTSVWMNSIRANTFHVMYKVFQNYNLATLGIILLLGQLKVENNTNSDFTIKGEQNEIW